MKSKQKSQPGLFDQATIKKEEQMAKKSQSSERQALIDKVRKMSERLKFMPGGTHQKKHSHES